MNMTPQEYQQYVKQKAPKSPLLKDTVLAFVVGGAICVVGQLILNGWTAAGLEEKTAGTDFRSEGFVTGMAAKMFLIAGPVIVFGTLASVIYGVVLVLLG